MSLKRSRAWLFKKRELRDGGGLVLGWGLVSGLRVLVVLAFFVACLLRVLGAMVRV